MKSRWALPAVLVASLGVNSFAQEKAAETKVDSKVESIGLFKNGLAVVRRSVELGGGGAYQLDDIPAPVHGTFWISSPVAVSALVSSRETDAPPRAGEGIDFQQQLVGRQVTIHFRDSGIPPTSGKVVQIARAGGDHAWNRTYQPPEYNYYGGRVGPAQGQFLILDAPAGRVYVETALIAHLSVEGTTVKHRQPVLILSVDDAAAQKKNQPVHVTITYLTKGIAWAPAYRVNLDDLKTLTVQQQAVIKNEMEDFKDADVQLISGFPSIEFAHVTSPLSLGTSWANFFTQLNQRSVPSRGLASNMMQSVSNSAASDPSVDLSAIPTGDGVDLHYQDIGKRSMHEGDSLLLTTGKGQASYERIVEWTVPDNRDSEGRQTGARESYEEPQQNDGSAWDAVRFKNPLDFPMTTAPALVTAGDRFNGQRQSFWVNTGEQTTLQITKALSVRTRSTEQEDPTTARQLLNIGGRNYRKAAVKGQLQVSNHRAEQITLVISRRFSGDLLKADENPAVSLAEGGVYSINKRNVLRWSITLAAGEARTINYDYSVLVIN